MDRAVFVHGSGPRDAAWSNQQALRTRYELVLVDRRGYGREPGANPDFEVDAADVADALEAGAHLVGFSYGGVGALLGALLRPDAVRTLTVIEPPAFGIARGHPAVEALMDRVVPVFAAAPESAPEEFVAAFGVALGLPARSFSEEGRAIADAFRRERPPWEAAIPLAELRDAAFPKLVVSGGWHEAFDAVCEVLEQELNAERLVLAEYGGHGVQHDAGFNRHLERFWETGRP